MKTLLTILILAVSISAFGQAPAIEWERCLGGTNAESAYAVQQTNDGGYILAGESDSRDGDVTSYQGDEDFWVVKLDATGVIQWQKSLGGTSNEIALSIQQTKDRGYIVAGGTQSNNGDVTGNHGFLGDYWVVKLDSIGNIQWQKSLGGTKSDQANSVAQTTDGGYIVAGFAVSTDGDVTGHHSTLSNLDYWLVKLDSAGSIQWQKSLGGTANDEAYSVQQTTDGGYVVAGESLSVNGDVTGHHGDSTKYDYWVVKLSSAGVVQWQKSLGGTGDDDASSILQTTDGGYIVAGTTNSFDGDVTGNHGSIDYWVVKLDSMGAIQWQKCYGGSGFDQANSIRQTKSGGYVITGASESYDGDVTSKYGNNIQDFWVVNINATGTLQWQECLGGSLTDYATSMDVTTDGGYIVTGRTNSYDGDVTGFHGNAQPDYWVVKLKGDISTAVKQLTIDNGQFSIYPNPANDVIAIKAPCLQHNTTYSITDITGRKILTGQLYNTANTIDISKLANGIYLLQVGNEVKQTFKIVKE